MPIQLRLCPSRSFLRAALLLALVNNTFNNSMTIDNFPINRLFITKREQTNREARSSKKKRAAMKNRGNGWGVDDDNNNNNNGNPGGERERIRPVDQCQRGPFHPSNPRRPDPCRADPRFSSRGDESGGSMRKFRGSIPRENPLPPLLQFAWKKESQRDPRIICGEYPHDLF